MTKSAVYTGRHWPLSIVAFFIVLALINVVVVYLALHSKSEYLETSPYEKGLAFDRVIEQRLAAKKSGLEPRYEFGAVKTSGLREIRLSLLGMAIPEQVTAVELEALRFSDARYDQRITLKRSGDIFVGSADLALSGLWLFRTALQLKGDQLLFETHETLP